MPPRVRRRTLELAGYQVPVVELTGAGDGPRLTVLAGVHGCEYAPMAAVRRWTRALAERDLHGGAGAGARGGLLLPAPTCLRRFLWLYATSAGW